MPMGTFLGNSRRDVSKADLYDTDNIPTVEISRIEHRPRGVGYTPPYRLGM